MDFFKNISIKLKIAIFNTILMSIMVTLVLFFMMSISGSIIEVNAERQVKEVVDDNADEIEYKNKKFDFDDVEFYEDDVTTLIYSDTGELLAGNIKNIEYLTLFPLENMILKHEVINDTDYFIYDKLVNIKNEFIYVRGIISVNAVSNTVNEMIFSALVALPIFIIFSAIGSYFISKKAFSPIEKIINTANDISNSDDLTLRINLENNKDEIHKLATTFDNMFERLEKSFKLEKQFSSDVSHELRTPVAIILAECEYTISDNAIEEDKNEALEVINRQAIKMQKIISNLLDLTRFDNGIIKAEFENINLSELLIILCEEQQTILNSNNNNTNNITLSYNIDDNIYGDFDSSMMIRMLSNLINNAYKYGKENGFIKVSLTKNTDSIIITIEDDGIGIKLSEQEKIYQRFYQVEKSRTIQGNGGSMGLGLAMVMQLVKLQKGVISLESELNKGSIFTIKFNI